MLTRSKLEQRDSFFVPFESEGFVNCGDMLKLRLGEMQRVDRK